MAAIFAFLWAAPIGPCQWFDDRALPSITLDDLERFHDPLLAIEHGATCSAIDRLLTEYEQRWWDQAGWQHEYERELARLRWVAECWRRLELAKRNDHGMWHRLDCLHQLRRLLGPGMYYAGCLPSFPTSALGYLSTEVPAPRTIEP